jgi:hypothetical protein
MTTSPRRIGLLILTVLALVWVLGTLMFTTVNLITQASSGLITTTLYQMDGMWSFQDTGDGRADAPVIAGGAGPVQVSVSGLSPSAIVLHLVVLVLGMLPQVALGIVAIRLLRRLLREAPFAGPLAREAAVAAVALLAIAVVGAFLGWIERIVIGAESGSRTFVSVFAIEPLLVTAGLVLLLVAAVFRSGERLQRDTEGLV